MRSLHAEHSLACLRLFSFFVTRAWARRLLRLSAMVFQSHSNLEGGSAQHYSRGASGRGATPFDNHSPEKMTVHSMHVPFMIAPTRP